MALPEGNQTLTVEAKDPVGNARQVQVPITVIDPTRREFRYDLQGSLVEERQVGTSQKTTSTYDPLSRLTAVARSTIQDPPSTILVSTYDGDGRRLRVTEGGVTPPTSYDGLLSLLERHGSREEPRGDLVKPRGDL